MVFVVRYNDEIYSFTKSTGMFDQIMELVRQHGQQAVVANPAVPDEHNEDVMKEASATVAEGIQERYQQGGPGAVQQLLEGAQSGNADHPEVQQLSSRFAGNIASKFGIPANAAHAIGASLIPMVLRMFSKKTGAGTGGFDIGSLLGSLTGGGLGNMGAKFGLDRNQDGKTDLDDLKSMFGK